MRDAALIIALSHLVDAHPSWGSGKPDQNAIIERVNRTFREEVRDQHLFSNLEEVRETTHWWMIAYNESRPHDGFNGATPHEYRYQSAKRSTFDLSA